MRPEDRARRRRARLRCACISLVAYGAMSGDVPIAAGHPAGVEKTPPTASRCSLAHATPGQASVRRLAGALRCLVNRQRRRRGIPRLQDDPALDQVAQMFADDMRRRRYFAHVSPEGRRLRDRLRSADMRASGEVIAWGCGRFATPAATVRAWLASPPHRRLLLAHRYTVLGAGVATGSPVLVCGPPGSTSVVELGRPR
jgi:uncharacterized protein YkwD